MEELEIGDYINDINSYHSHMLYKLRLNFTADWDILWLKGVEQYAKYQTYFRFAKLQRRAA